MENRRSSSLHGQILWVHRRLTPGLLHHVGNGFSEFWMASVWGIVENPEWYLVGCMNLSKFLIQFFEHHPIIGSAQSQIATWIPMWIILIISIVSDNLWCMFPQILDVGSPKKESFHASTWNFTILKDAIINSYRVRLACKGHAVISQSRELFSFWQVSALSLGLLLILWSRSVFHLSSWIWFLKYK